MRKRELIGVFRSRMRVERFSTDCYWLVPREGSRAFGVEVRYFDPDSIEEAMGRLGVPVKGEFTVALSAIDAELWLRQS